MNEEFFMKQVLKLALRGKGRTSPNPLVGALVERNNQVLAAGWHKQAGSPHAEVIALKKAGSKAKGANLYVNLEPCYHFGRTPPCVDQLIESGVKKVFIGMRDPNKLTNGKSIQKLKRAGVQVKTGILKRECQQVNEAFIKSIKIKRPFVTAKIAQTLDGKIATANNDSKWITSHKTRAFSRQMRSEFDAILVGINTVLVDNPGLNSSRKQHKIKKVILDSKLRIPLNAKIFKSVLAENCYIATTQQASATKLNRLRRKGVHVLLCPTRGKRVKLKWLFKELVKYEITSILIEGGAQVIGNALKEGLIDQMHVYISLKIIGDQKAKSAVDGLNIRKINKSLSLKNSKITKLDQELFIKGYVHRNR